MSDELLFQRTVAGLSLEISAESGESRATITFPYPDPRFERGGFPVAVGVVVELARQLARRDRLRSLFLTELAPAHGEDDAMAASPLPLDELAAWVAEQRPGTLGVLDPARGCWLELNDGLETLVRLTTPLHEASAENSRLRLVLLENESNGAPGWDIAHTDGIITLGPWRTLLADDPAPLHPDDVASTIVLLDALAAVLGPRLAN